MLMLCLLCDVFVVVVELRVSPQEVLILLEKQLEPVSFFHFGGRIENPIGS